MSQHLLWFCGGFDAAILDLNQCRSIRPKYSMMGATVCVTTAFAAYASRYFFSTIVSQAEVPYLVALWACAICSIDRYIVSSTRKRGTILPYIEGGRQVKLLQSSFPWMNAFPRVLMAICISLAVSAPFEVTLQQSRIESERRAEVAETREKLEPGIAQEKKTATAETTEQLNLLTARLKYLEAIKDQATKEAVGEADGTLGTKIRNPGPIYVIKRAEQVKAEAALAKAHGELDPQIRKLEEEKDATERRINDRFENQIHFMENDRSFPSNWEILQALKSKSPAINILSWGLVVVFLALELAPVLVKLFASYDTYDSYLQRLENIAIIDNLLVEIDAHLRYDLWVKLREIRAKFLEDQMSFLLGDSKLNEDTRRVVGNRASNEFRDTASSALRDKQPVISYMKPRSQGGRELVVILRERLKEGKDRIAGTFRRLGEFLKTSLSAMEILRWLGIKIGE